MRANAHTTDQNITVSITIPRRQVELAQRQGPDAVQELINKTAKFSGMYITAWMASWDSDSTEVEGEYRDDEERRASNGGNADASEGAVSES